MFFHIFSFSRQLSYTQASVLYSSECFSFMWNNYPLFQRNFTQWCKRRSCMLLNVLFNTSSVVHTSQKRSIFYQSRELIGVMTLKQVLNMTEAKPSTKKSSSTNGAQVLISYTCTTFVRQMQQPEMYEKHLLEPCPKHKRRFWPFADTVCNVCNVGGNVSNMTFIKRDLISPEEPLL